MIRDEGPLSGPRGLTAVLRYYVGHLAILVYLIPNAFLIAWLVVTREPSYFVWFLVGFGVFLPQEYLTHVHILHFRPPRNRTAYKLLYRAHYGHHEFPKRIDLMWIPLWLTIPLLAVNLVVFAPLAGTPAETAALTSGLLTGYLLFEWCHLLCHVPLRLNSRTLSLMRTRHLWHHYRNEHYWFSVQPASLVFDFVGRTVGTSKTVPRSGTSFKLGVATADPRAEAARRCFADNSSGDLERSGIWL